MVKLPLWLAVLAVSVASHSLSLRLLRIKISIILFSLLTFFWNNTQRCNLQCNVQDMLGHVNVAGLDPSRPF